MGEGGKHGRRQAGGKRGREAGMGRRGKGGGRKREMEQAIIVSVMARCPL